MTNDRFGPALSAECEAWARAFTLEPRIVEEAFDGYAELLAAEGQLATEQEAADRLADLRVEVARMVSSDRRAPHHVQSLETLALRLDRLIGHATVLEDSGLAEPAASSLRSRLVAGRALVSAIRAALARRAKKAR